MSRRLLAAIAAALLLLLGTTAAAHAAPGDLTISLPGGEQGEDPTPLVEGTADPTYPVHVLVDGVEVATAPVVNGAWSFQLVDPIPEGQQAQITAQVRDDLDQVIADQSVFYFVLPAVGTATIVSPAAGSTVGTTPEVRATITGPVQDAQLLVDGQPNGDYIGLTDEGTHQFLADPLTGGPHTLEVAVLDAFDREFTSAPVTVTVDATPPPPATIDSPADGSVVTDRTPTFAGRALPGAPVVVRFDRSYEIICQTTARADGSWSCQPEGQGAQYFGSFEGKRQTVTVLVTNQDEVGNENSSAAITLVVDYRPKAAAPQPSNPPVSPPAAADPASAVPAAAAAPAVAPELANTGASTLPGLATALLLVTLGLALGAASRRLPQR